MTRTSRQIALTAMAIGCAALCFVAVLSRDALRDPRPPDDEAGMARWLAGHPADWRTAGRISESALDSSSPNRVALWRGAYDHAKRLTPPLTTVNAAFVRGGLFHWYELSASDRARILTAAAPLMQEREFFEKMHVPLWQLTRDLRWIRRVSPDTVNARDALASLALSQGLFADYRALREDTRRANLREFDARRRLVQEPSELLTFLPARLDRSDDRMVQDILTELDRRAFDAKHMNTRIESLVSFALRHDLQPLAGIRPLVETPTPLLSDVTRARAALAMDDRTLATQIELASAVPGAAEWNAYYLDRARFEARRRDAPGAAGYLRRAAIGGTTLATLVAEKEVAALLGEASDRTRLLAQAAQPRVWAGACGAELCGTVTTTEYTAGSTLTLRMAPSQTDATPPYVAVYVDDALVAEADLRRERDFSIPVSPGLHELEIRLLNPRTRNGIQRRVRLS